jgi:hypothetical protein
MDTGDLFPRGKVAWEVNLASPPMDKGVPWGMVTRSVKVASPNIDTGDLFLRGKVAWGVKLASSTIVTVDLIPRGKVAW